MYTIKQLEKQYWPEGLFHIPDKPERLDIIGTLPQQEYIWISIVGSRKFSEYGKHMCQKIVSELSEYPVIIVSGLAIGIDSIAHQAALDSNITTIAFPGSGLDKKILYPRRNVKLAENILRSNGCLISEYPSTHPAYQSNFPERNRLMVGVSQAVIIIEAAEQSGTMITARMTSDYNKDLFVVPGRATDEGSAGPLKLLKIGAAPITSGQDIIDHYNLKKIPNDSGTSTVSNTPLDNMSPEECEILNLFSGSISREDIISKSSFAPHITNGILTSLEIHDHITISNNMINKK